MNFPHKAGEPPPGYDDQSIIPKERLKLLTAEFEKELKKIEDYFEAELPGQFQNDKSLKLQLNSMHYAAKELGSVYLQQVEAVIHAYHAFENSLELTKLSELITLVEKLKFSLSN